MLLKLKRLVASSAALSLLLVFGAAGTAAANTTQFEFACSDGSTGINITTNGKHESIVKCKTGVDILYVNYDGHQPTAVQATCSQGQVSTSVDTPNQPTSKYVFYCAEVGGNTDHQTVTRLPITPKLKQTKANDVRCTDGTPAPNNDLSKCPAATVDPAATSGNCSTASKCDLISKYINPFINFLAALVGVAVVISIIIGGIQYSSSGGDPQKVSAAKNRIRNAIVALVTFLFLYALLNFLIPGGLV